MTARLSRWFVVLFIVTFWLVLGAALGGCATQAPVQRCTVSQPGALVRQADGSIKVVTREPVHTCDAIAPTKDPSSLDSYTLLPQSEEPATVSRGRDPLRPGKL